MKLQIHKRCNLSAFLKEVNETKCHLYVILILIPLVFLMSVFAIVISLKGGFLTEVGEGFALL